MIRRPYAPSIACVLVLMCSAAPTQAQSDADRAAARRLAKEGLALKKEGNCKEALPLLERAQAIYDAPTHLLAIAQCQAQLGKLVGAAETYRKLGRSEIGPRSPAAFRHAQETRERELAELVPRIATVIIDVVPPVPPRVSLRLDGEGLSPQFLGVVRPMNPGEHQVEAEAPNHAPVRQTFVLKEGEKGRVNLTLKSLAPPAPSATASAAPTSAATPPPTTPPPPPMLPPPPDEGPSRKTVGYVLGGVGAASVLVGGYFGIRALAKKSDRASECSTTSCSQDGITIQNDAFKAATLSNVFFGVGLLGLGAGAYLVLTAPDTPSATAIRLGPGSVQLSGRFLCAHPASRSFFSRSRSSAARA
jgi:hypothetical protein